MKAPNEIKLALEICAADSCRGCPYEADYDCYNKNKDALAYIQQLESAQPKWISVEERLPEENFEVLMLFKHNMAVGFYDGDGEWCANTDDGYHAYCDGTPTHWMQLPSAEGIE